MPQPPTHPSDPGYPVWVRTALLELEVEYASACRGPKGQQLQTRVMALGGDTGGHLSTYQRHTLARAWMSAGRGIPAPPMQRLPAVLHFLTRMALQDSLLESWVLALCGEQLARQGWEPPGSALCRIVKTQTRRTLCRYWEWFLVAIASRAGQSIALPLALDDRITAARVAVLLYGPRGLTTLLRRLRAWEAMLTRGNPAEFASFATAHLHLFAPNLKKHRIEPTLLRLWGSARDQWQSAPSIPHWTASTPSAFLPPS